MDTQSDNSSMIGGAAIRNDFYNYIINDDFPCIMAQTVMRTDHVQFKTYTGLGAKATASRILTDLGKYLRSYDFDSNEFFTFIAAFPASEPLTEEAFEARLWQQLQYLHEEDQEEWDPTVSRKPESNSFSFSLLGRAFYIVGIHPGSSRIARRSPVPAIVFNLHHQFERLRDMGSYDTIRDKIRERDLALQGSINPMLSNFGEKSEARQYSGMAVGAEWQCPFKHK